MIAIYALFYCFYSLHDPAQNYCEMMQGPFDSAAECRVAQRPYLPGNRLPLTDTNGSRYECRVRQTPAWEPLPQRG